MEARKRSRRSAKAAGRSFENDLVEVFLQRGLAAVRLGHQGTKDRGDIRVELAPEHVFEAKNCRAPALTQWWREALRERDNAQARFAWIVHKRHGVSDPSEQWVTATTGQLAEMLAEIASLRDQLAKLATSVDGSSMAIGELLSRQPATDTAETLAASKPTGQPSRYWRASDKSPVLAPPTNPAADE